MKFPSHTSLQTGVAVPLSALKSRSSFGIGEFPDLVPFAQWCRRASLSVIQLLPVNDTGFESSPYSALSAFALHPIYLRLSDLPGYETIEKEATELRDQTNSLARVSHQDVLGRKLPLLRKLYETHGKAENLEAWTIANPWAKPYAVFCTLKQRNALASWVTWKTHRTVQPNDIEKLWNEERTEASFYVWVQMHAEKQFRSAVRSLEELGVALKGDIPILLNDDSADVWAHSEYFDLTWRAGAPPDGMNPEGQNWGFPVYRWENLQRDGYQWWKQRLIQAAKFYHAYRIDHVLGFFRIWATPQENFTAQLGLFQPNEPITRKQLYSLGFDDGRIVWMSEPHIFGLEIRERLGVESEAVIAKALVQVGKEDLYKFSPSVQGERSLAALGISDGARGWLVQWYRNRMLLKVGDDHFVTAANYFGTRAYDSLSNEERWNFERIVHDNLQLAQKTWETQGRELLEFMKNTTDMLVCAEDLGSIPDCVPLVLGEKRILGLKIIRWARDWNAPGQPYFPVRDYPSLSVCAPSVHDTSTLRLWWEEERDHKGFLEAIGLKPEDDGPYTSALAQKVMAGILTCRSQLCIPALQDWLALDDEFRTADAHQERVNVPGTVGQENWSYRMKPYIETLLEAKKFTQMIADLNSKRNNS